MINTKFFSFARLAVVGVFSLGLAIAAVAPSAAAVAGRGGGNAPSSGGNAAAGGAGGANCGSACTISNVPSRTPQLHEVRAHSPCIERVPIFDRWGNVTDERFLGPCRFRPIQIDVDAGW